MPELVLSGSADELTNPQAHKIIAAASFHGLTLHISNHHHHHPVVSFSAPPPSPSGRSTLALLYGSDPPVAIYTTNAALRFMARLACTTRDETTDVEEALTDGWLMFGYQSVDLALQVKSEKDWARCCVLMDRQLSKSTYLVGTKVSMADVRLVVSFYLAEQAEFWNPDDGDHDDDSSSSLCNLHRWYHDLSQQDWFQKSLESVNNIS